MGIDTTIILCYAILELKGGTIMTNHNKQQQAYATPVKDKLRLLTGKVITLNTYNTSYPVEFIEPLLFYMAYGLPDKLDTNTLTSYFNQHYTKGTPLNKVGLHLISPH